MVLGRRVLGGGERLIKVSCLVVVISFNAAVVVMSRVLEVSLLRGSLFDDSMEEYVCENCTKVFSRKSNLKRHMQTHRQKIIDDEINKIHHHGLQIVDVKFITRDTFCDIHESRITEGKIFHCFPCNFSVCLDCIESDCTFCNKDICKHKQIFIIMK